MLERYAFYIVAAAAALAVISFFWLVRRAFRLGWLWGFGVLFVPPLGILFALRYKRAAIGPVLLFVLAAITAAAPYGVSYYERHFAPQEPFEQRVNNEVRLTLTGLKDFDYSTLKGRDDIVVLQMANPDVNDQTLGYLSGMTRLRKLDVSDSQISDAGLAVIASMPQLEELYLARTHITDEGFQKHLAPKESLHKLDLTGTEIKSKTKRAWKNAQAEVREYVD